MPNIPRNNVQLSGFYGSLYQDGNPLNDLFYRNGTLLGNQITNNTYIMRNPADAQTLINVYQRVNVPQPIAQAYLQSWAITGEDECPLSPSAISSPQMSAPAPAKCNTTHAELLCKMLDVNNDASPFARCIKSSDEAMRVAQNKHDNCKVDVCAYASINHPSAPSAEDGACTMLTSMESHCHVKANVPPTPWRRTTGEDGGFCAVKCNTGEKHHGCMRAPTCQHLTGSLHPKHEHHCTAGCECADGHVRDHRSNHCVMKHKCHQPAAAKPLAHLPHPPRKHCEQCAHRL